MFIVVIIMIKLFIRSDFSSLASSILYTHVPDCTCNLHATKKEIQPLASLDASPQYLDQAP
jgi:hypothetical protein